MSESVRKRIAIVSNTSWSIYNFRLSLIRFLKEQGFHVHVIAPKDRFSARLVSEGISYHNLFLDNYSINPFKDIQTTRQLSKIYKEYNFDFVIHYTIKLNIYGSYAAQSRGIPSIAITTGLGHLFSFKNSLVRQIVRLLYVQGCRMSKEVGFLNESDREEFIRKKIVQRSKTFVLPSEGIDLEYFSPINGDNYNRKTKTFLFAGRVLWEKGVGEFKEAAERILKIHPDFKFQILGFVDPSNPNAIPFEKLESWQNSGIIEYLGETEDIRPFLRNVDCVVFPSYYREGISRILLEAASMAIPIITTDNVGCRDVVAHNKSGYLCKPKDVDDLVDKINLFVALDSEDKTAMGQYGRELVSSKFDIEIVNQHYLNLINKYIPQSAENEIKSSVKS